MEAERSAGAGASWRRQGGTAEVGIGADRDAGFAGRTPGGGRTTGEPQSAERCCRFDGGRFVSRGDVDDDKSRLAQVLFRDLTEAAVLGRLKLRLPSHACANCSLSSATVASPFTATPTFRGTTISRSSLAPRPCSVCRLTRTTDFESNLRCARSGRTYAPDASYATDAPCSRPSTRTRMKAKKRRNTAPVGSSRQPAPYPEES